jgi:hypothetical protein
MTSSDISLMRTIIDLPDAERQRLDAICRQRGLSRAEGVRQALRAWIASQEVNHRQVFGLWQSRPEASLAMQERLRREWDRP